MQPLGRNNPQLTSLRKLAKSNRERELQARSLAEGPKVLDAALRAGYRPEMVFLGKRWIESEEGSHWEKRVANLDLEGRLVDDELLKSILDAKNALPLAGLVAWEPCPPEPEHKTDDDWVLVACNVQDPGNLGTLWRTAEAAGATAIVRIGDGASLRHPRTWRGSIGSCFRLPAWESDTETLLQWREQYGWKFVGADAHNGRPYHDLDWPPRTALLLGSEAHGIPEPLAAVLDATVSIPMQGAVESLSVGAAAAVLCFSLAARNH